VTDPFFIDECLTLALVARAHSRGHYATHVAFMGLQGEQDWDLLPMLIEKNYVLVTNNGEEFKMRYAKLDIHPGLVIIVPGGIVKERQVELFDLALDVIEALGDTINKVIEVAEDGTVLVKDLPVAGVTCTKCGMTPCACGEGGGNQPPRTRTPGGLTM
jgi:predicted nuclease of predicted toxin-antitoxin system